MIPNIFWIDLFSGAGGTTTGIHLIDKSENVEVVACVNHDINAIESHKENHPDCLHFVEDVRDWKVVVELKHLVSKLRKEHPGCIINIWASLECTNYSKAKGGMPRNADSRTLANALFMYIEELTPDYLYIENVREFMAWGPLDKDGKPISKLNGRDYVKWINKVQSYEYNFDYKLLNAADFGAYTSRERYFGQFAKKGMPINWPEPTHTKNPNQTESLFAPLKKWKPVREVLDLSDEGQSIFTRKKPLSENTLKRIYAGLIKFVAGGKESFTKVYNSVNNAHRVNSEFLYHIHGGNPNSKVWGIDSPNRTVTSLGNHYKIKTVFLKKYFSGRPEGKVIGIDGPAGAIKTIDGHAIVSSEFLAAYYSTGDNVSPLSNPCPVVSTKDRFKKVKPIFFIQNEYSGGGQLTSLENPNPTLLSHPKQKFTSVKFLDQQYGQFKPKGINEPANTITSNPKLNLIKVKPWLMDTNFNNVGNTIDEPGKVITANRKYHYLMNPQYNSKGSSLEKPCFTLIARMDKMPPYLIGAESGNYGVIVYKEDSDMTIKIKEFMAIYGIVDIRMRMLKISELKLIQGFPKDYVLKGTKTEQKKYIGNAVEVNQAKVICLANYSGIKLMLQQKLA